MKRSLILLLAAFTAGHAVFLVLRSPFGADDSGYVGAVFLVLLLPAVVAIVGLVRASKPLVGAAGAMYLLPALMSGLAVIPFAGFLAIGGLDRGQLPSSREMVRGIAVTIVGTAAWIVPYLAIGPDGRIDGWRLGVAIALVVAAIALAIGRPTRQEASGIER